MRVMFVFCTNSVEHNASIITGSFLVPGLMALACPRGGQFGMFVIAGGRGPVEWWRIVSDGFSRGEPRGAEGGRSDQQIDAQLVQAACVRMRQRNPVSRENTVAYNVQLMFSTHLRPNSHLKDY